MKKKKAGGNAGFCDGALHIPANNAAIQADLACGGGAVAGRMTEEEKKQKIAAAAARARAGRDSDLEKKRKEQKEQDMRATATAATQNTTATAAAEATQEEEGETKANAYMHTYTAYICIYVRLQQLQQKCVQLQLLRCNKKRSKRRVRRLLARCSEHLFCSVFFFLKVRRRRTPRRLTALKPKNQKLRQMGKKGTRTSKCRSFFFIMGA